MSNPGRLLELQRADDRVAALRADVAAIEASLHGDPRLDRVRSDAHDARDAQRRADADVAAAELEAATIRDRAKQIDRQLYGGSVRNPQDLLTLQRELADVRTHLAAAEEEELGRMQTAEDAEASRQRLDAEVARLETARAAAAGPDAVRLASTREELDDAVAERARVAGALARTEVALYDQVATRRHPAVVPLLGEACGGCRIPLGMREVRAARTGSELVQCPTCDRIIAG